MPSKQVQLGHHYFYRQQFKEAIAAYQNASEPLHYFLGTAYLAQGLSQLAEGSREQVVAIQQEIVTHFDNAIKIYHQKGSEKIPAEMSTIIEMANSASAMMKKSITAETQIWARKLLMQLDLILFVKQYIAKHVKYYNDQVKEKHADVITLEQLVQSRYPNNPTIPEVLSLRDVMSLYTLLMGQDTPKSDYLSKLFQAVEKKLCSNFNDDSEVLLRFTAEIISALMRLSGIQIDTILDLRTHLASIHIKLVTTVQVYLISANIFNENTLKALMNIAEKPEHDESLKFILNQFLLSTPKEVAQENLCHFYRELKQLSSQHSPEKNQLNELEIELVRGLINSSSISADTILSLSEQLKSPHVDVIKRLLPYLLEGNILDAECIVPLINIAEQNVDCAVSINFIMRKFTPSLRNFLLQNRKKIGSNFKELYQSILLRFFSLCLNEENSNDFYKQIARHDRYISTSFFSDLELYLDVFSLMKKNIAHVDCNTNYKSIMNLFFAVRAEFSVEYRTQYDSLRRFIQAISHNDNLCPYYLSLFSLSLRFGKNNIDHLIRLLETESSWDAFSYQASEFLFYDFLQKHPEKSLDLIKQEFSTYSQDVQYPLSGTELDNVFEQYLIILEKGKRTVLLEELKEAKKHCLDELKNHPDNKDNHLLLLAIIRQEMMNVFKIFPYNTQIINVLALWNAPNHRCIAQIMTGEGKSCIVAMLATFLGCQGYPVDVITTSADLAKRDARKFKPFYEKFELTVQDNAKHFQNAYIYSADIVYGATADFEFAYLYELSHTKSTRNGRPLCAAIVDEADSMFIDMQGGSARVTSNLADGVSDEVYQEIWNYLSAQQATAVNLKRHLQANFKDKLFDDDVIEDWYTSYHRAISYTLGTNYIIKEAGVGESSTPAVLEICIVDYEYTGQVLNGMRWNKGLHSFLEIKHQLKIKKDYLTSCCISHPSYFNQYALLFGLTGTVGTKKDREELIKIYGVTTYDSPPYHPSQKKQEQALVTPDKEAQLQTIVNTMLSLVAAERPVLILCKTINDSNQLYALCAAKISTVQLYNGLQNLNDTENLIALAGNAGMVTIATNTAGRGTDIIISLPVAKKGGLHVIATFLMSNPRVEVQGFGRAARQGNPGSFQYIVALSDFKNIDTQNKTPNELMTAWQAHRETLSQAHAMHHIWSSKYLILNYLLQKLFFTLSLGHCKQLKNDWIQCFNKMELMFSSLYGSRSEPEKIAQYEQIIRELIKKFWLEHELEDKYPLATHCRKHVRNDSLVSFLVNGEPLHHNILLSIYPTQMKPSPNWRGSDYAAAIESHGLFRERLLQSINEQKLLEEISAALTSALGEFNL